MRTTTAAVGRQLLGWEGDVVMNEWKTIDMRIMYVVRIARPFLHVANILFVYFPFSLFSIQEEPCVVGR